ncbi:MAG: sterol desaturase family protein [Pseudomonadales bacterium]|nr:sterol desaturase family protein [Pseudomonadales bacterium]
MSEFVSQHEVNIRLGFFFGIFAVMALWELLAPRRQLSQPKPVRWANNLGLVVLNSIILRLIFPAAAVGVAVFAASNGWGLLNHFTLPLSISVIISIIALDMIIYFQHVMLHAVPTFWRLHRVHHADLDYDLTTGARFHPLEIVLSILIKFAAILLLGAPVLAVIIFEIVLNGMAMFNHGNVGLPPWLDRIVRLFVVTPDMHRVHHSTEDNETNSNFGFNLSIWDRLFGTYIDQPRKGQLGMEIGIHTYRNPKQTTWITGMLVMPFKGQVEGYAINRREWSRADESPVSTPTPKPVPK